MNSNKPIPVKYFYYGMLICTILISSLFFFLRQREANEKKALNKRGITVNAWVTKLYETKSTKKSNPIYYMEIGFFADTTKIPLPIVTDTISKTKTASDKLLESLAKKNGEFKTTYW